MRKTMQFSLSKNEEDQGLVKLDGFIVPLKDGSYVPHESLMDEFTDWLESKGYGFTGISKQVDADGNPIKDIQDKNK